MATTYDSATKRIVSTASRVSSANGNVSGLETIMCLTEGNTNVYSGMSLLVKLPGSTIFGESIGTGDGVTKDFATAFPYLSNGQAFVDGVINPAVTFSKEPIKYTDLGAYFIAIDPLSTPENHIPFCSTTPGGGVINRSYDKAVWFNQYYEAGIASYSYSQLDSLECSNDLTAWTPLDINGVVPDAYKNCKYWRAKSSGAAGQWYGLTAPASHVGKSIHFSTAPAVGAAITGNYQSSAIAKDANHVFDLTVTIQLGEPTM